MRTYLKLLFEFLAISAIFCAGGVIGYEFPQAVWRKILLGIIITAITLFVGYAGNSGKLANKKEISSSKNSDEE